MYYCSWLLLILHVAPWFSAGGFSVLATLTSLYRRILPAVWGYRFIYIHYIYVNNSHKSASQSPLPAIDLFRLLGPHKNRNLEFSPLKDSSKSRLSSSSSQKSRMHFYCHCCCSDWYIVYIVFAALLCIVICIFFAPLPFGQRRVVCETWSEYKIVHGESVTALWLLVVRLRLGSSSYRTGEEREKAA